jgi:hypothetical protein
MPHKIGHLNINTEIKKQPNLKNLLEGLTVDLHMQKNDRT